MEKIYYTTKGIYRQVNENFGVVKDSEEKEYFIFKRDRNNAFGGDLVEIKIKKLEDGGKKAEAIVTNILKRSSEPIVGTFIKKKSQDFAFVRAYNTFGGKDIFVYSEDFAGATDGDIILVQIIKGKEKPVGKVIEILGKGSDSDILEKVILIQNNIRIVFPSNVISDAKKLKEISNIGTRLDLRNEMIVTIDGEDAKDLDDAIGVKILDNGNYELGVHIADVAEYVQFLTPLDIEAKKRGTSVYLPGSVIPMLPKEISDNLCSLNTSGDKATLSIIVEIDKTNGRILKTKIAESVIRSKARLTYNEVWNFVGKIEQSSQISKNPELQEMLEKAYALYKIIYSRRKKDGKMEFDFPEIKLELDENKKPIKVYKQVRNAAHKIIEEFMIIANEEISKFFSEKKIPFLYRIHEKPSLESIQELKKILEEYSIFIDENNITPLLLNEVIASLSGKKEEYLLSKQVLFSMSKAKYSDKILGHFGLGLKYYSHFTSPIRRYPDLQIHRIIKEFLNKNMDNEQILKYKKSLNSIAELCSSNEQKAEEVERKITFLKTVEYMEKHIGELFDAKVSGLNANGIYAELESGIEGFISSRGLIQKYKFIEETKYYEEISTKKKLNLGENIKIKVIKADKTRGFLDFELI
ncbi:MAG: ribonuclease R [Candidatus Gracilibacteria bacterium]|nr:ribonuclease R [Candidatus Gracilibacteria bacterium]MDD2908202.1 ribonuclease R [Candidatus Gracilibacteria bacterium]